MKVIISALFFSLISLSLLASPLEKTITLDTGSGKLEGSLLIPEAENKKVVALIIAGSGPTDRNGNNPQMKNNALKMLAEQLVAIGVSSVRYDKRGVAGSQNAFIKEADLRFDNYIQDAVSWVNYLQANQKFEQVIVIGHSEGSLIGMVAAQQAKVSKFISLAGAGDAIDKVIRQQLSAQPAAVKEQAERILNDLAAGKTTDDVPFYLNSIFRPNVQP